MFTPPQPLSVVKIAPLNCAINAVPAVTVRRANAAKVKNIVRLVKILDLLKREPKFVVIRDNLLRSTGLPVELTQNRRNTGREWGHCAWHWAHPKQRTFGL